MPRPESKLGYAESCTLGSQLRANSVEEPLARGLPKGSVKASLNDGSLPPSIPDTASRSGKEDLFNLHLPQEEVAAE